MTKDSPLLKKTLKDLSVLLVEDNEINRLYASSILKIWDCTIDIAENGSVALEKIKINDYDIILMDIQMPVMDGFETTKAIRTSMAAIKSQIPIIALTANASRKDIDQCLASGMNDCLPKPFTPEDLYTKLILFKSGIKKKNTELIDTNTLVTKKIIDLAYLKKVSNDNQKFMDDMLIAFLESIPKSIHEIITYTNENDWLSLSRSVHKLKPSLTLIGMHKTKERAMELEDLANQRKDIDTIVSHSNEICQDLNQALNELLALKNLPHAPQQREGESLD